MSLAATASKLLAANGEGVTITFPPSTPAFDPVTGAAQTPSAAQTVTGNGYPAGYTASEIDGEAIKAGDIKLILEKVGTRPEVNATATVDGKTYRIMDVQFIRRSGADIIYICQLRAN
jgi:hypothetical protein